MDKLTAFEEIEGLGGIYCAQKGTLRCTAIRLEDESLCLYSPVAGLTEGAKSSLSLLGEVRFLLAPNHYHNKGIVEYVNAFPGAHVLASDAASSRLKKVTGVPFGNLDMLSRHLPKGTSILQPEGLKTGEIWMGTKVNKRSSWIVADAFCTAKKNSKNSISETPDILGTFPKFAVENAPNYRGWIENQIKKDQPVMVLPCHGSLIYSEELSQKLLQLIQVRF